MTRSIESIPFLDLITPHRELEQELVAVFRSALSGAGMDQLRDALNDPHIRFAIRLSVLSASITTILAMWVAVPVCWRLRLRSASASRHRVRLSQPPLRSEA